MRQEAPNGSNTLGGPPPPSPEDFASAGPQGSPRTPKRYAGPLVALATALAVALVLGVVFWLVSRSTTGGGAEMDEALSGLEASISSAEEALDRARNANDVLTAEAESTGDAAALELADEADEAATQFAVALERTREVQASAEAQKPSTETVEKVKEATTALDDLTIELHEVTETVEETTQELQAGSPQMNLEQIAKGDYSSVRGHWEAEPREMVDAAVSSTIDFGPGNEFTYKFGDVPAYSEVLVGDGLQEASLERWDPALYWDKNYVGCSQFTSTVRQAPGNVSIRWECVDPSSNSISHYIDFAFFEPGVPVNWPNALFMDDPDSVIAPTLNDLPQNLDVPRIAARAITAHGGDKYSNMKEHTFYLTGSGGIQADAQEDPADEAKDPKCIAPVEGAYPCAGGPIPEGAKQLPGFVPKDTGTSEQVASFGTPSGNIHCSVETTETICIVGSWDSSTLPGYIEEQGGAGGVTLKAAGPPNYSIHSGAPIGGNRPGGMAVDTVPYGTVWSFGDFVFASEENGLTFWNAKSGYGALINKAGFYPFGPG